MLRRTDCMEWCYNSIKIESLYVFYIKFLFGWTNEENLFARNVKRYENEGFIENFDCNTRRKEITCVRQCVSQVVYQSVSDLHLGLLLWIIIELCRLFSISIFPYRLESVTVDHHRLLPVTMDGCSVSVERRLTVFDVCPMTHTSAQLKIPVFSDWSTLGIFPRVSYKYLASSLNCFHININISVITVTVNINHKLVHNIRAGCVFVTTPSMAEPV